MELRKASLVVLAASSALVAAQAADSEGSDPVVRVSLTRKRPIADSIDRAVERVLDAHEQPCVQAQRQGLPCFPVSVQENGPRFSVAEAMRRFRATGRPAPSSVPTNEDLAGQLSGAPRSASGGVGFDPGCAVKSLSRALRGRGNTFYLYRVRDAQGEHPLLTDEKLTQAQLAARPQIGELLGAFSGECEAIAAWRKASREFQPAANDLVP